MAEFAPTVDRMTKNVFLVVASDREDGDTGRLRDTALEGHLEYVEKNCQRYLICGPMWSGDGATIVGSFFVVEADDEDAARALVSGDPYVDAGIYADIRVTKVTASAGRWMGGVIWESAASVRARTAG
ncbi:MAG: YciI family protein [Pseudomonadota bacterium]